MSIALGQNVTIEYCETIVSIANIVVKCLSCELPSVVCCLLQMWPVATRQGVRTSVARCASTKVRETESLVPPAFQRMYKNLTVSNDSNLWSSLNMLSGSVCVHERQAH